MALRTRVDWKAVANGGLVALLGSSVVLVAVLIIEAAVTVDKDSNVFFPLYLLVLLAMACGGFVAARLAPETPLLHGALAPLGAFLVILVVAILIKVAKGTSWDLGNLVVIEIFNLFMSMSAGVLGARLAQRRMQQR